MSFHSKYNSWAPLFVGTSGTHLEIPVTADKRGTCNIIMDPYKLIK